MRPWQRLSHCVGKLQLRLDRLDRDLAELDHLSYVMVGYVDVFCSIWLTQSAGPFFTTPIIFIYNNVIWIEYLFLMSNLVLISYELL